MYIYKLDLEVCMYIYELDLEVLYFCVIAKLLASFIPVISFNRFYISYFMLAQLKIPLIFYIKSIFP